MKISSVHNPRFRAAMALKSSRGRRRSGKIIVFGVREVGRFLKANPQSDAELFFCKDAAESVDIDPLSALASRQSIPCIEVDQKLMQLLSFGDRIDGVVLVAQRPPTSLDRLSVAESALLVVAESLEKPGNLGALTRVCDGAGVAALISTDPRTDVFHPNAIRASLGCVFALPIATASTHETLLWLEQQQFKVFLATPDPNAMIYSDCDLTGRAAIVLGGEAEGLSPIWLESSRQTLRIPMLGIADSLNISTAAAVLIYESLRQRTAKARQPRSQTPQP